MGRKTSYSQTFRRNDQISFMINFEDFTKLELRVGTVLQAEEVKGSEKLIKQIVDFGSLGKKQILSGIKKWYKPSQLIGKQFIYVTNLEPRMIMGMESQGMLLCAAVDPSESLRQGKLTLLKPLSKISAGAKIE